MDDPVGPPFQAESYDWDEGNTDKNWLAHQVSRAECEEVFFNEPLLVGPDDRHSEAEQRFYILGQTNDGRRLTVVFTIRAEIIRVISARDVSRRERLEYQVAQNA